MIYDLYAIQDTMVGFNAPFVMVNENVAKREYTNWLKTQKNPEDMRLFKVGTFDDSTGTVLPLTPECIMGGGEANGNSN